LTDQRELGPPPWLEIVKNRPRRRVQNVLLGDVETGDSFKRLTGNSCGSGGRELIKLIALSGFLDDGCIEIDSNVVERAIRPIALNRKNALFADSDGGGEHWALIASLIETGTARLSSNNMPTNI
jgi:transposase IS66 family protein